MNYAQTKTGQRRVMCLSRLGEPPLNPDIMEKNFSKCNKKTNCIPALGTSNYVCNMNFSNKHIIHAHFS